MSLNINQNTLDIFYRYKMEPVKITKIGRNKNTHTNLDNLEKISSKINTSTDILLQYIGNIIGCSVNKDTKSGKNIIYYLKGDYDTSSIQEIIYKFIDFASLCKGCTIPELTPRVRKNRLCMSCSACGYSYELVGNNKYNDRLVENMIKYYSINEFVSSKGNMVSKKSTKDDESADNSANNSSNNSPKTEKSSKKTAKITTSSDESDDEDFTNNSVNKTVSNNVNKDGPQFRPIVYVNILDD